MSASTVHVGNISTQTSEKDVKDFFSFCGKITKLEITSAGQTKDATVTFEKETAAKTALLLDNTQLGATQVKVTSASGSTEDDGSHFAQHGDSDEITQEMKPRSRIVAEYLAHGYAVGDVAIQRAIDLDRQHGVSTRFVAMLQALDKKFAATGKAKSVDESYGITPRASSLLSELTSYYEMATSTPTGKKLADFYTLTSRQVQDIHAEARRLAALKKQESSEKTSCECGSDLEKCSCAPGKCVCASCPKSKVEKVAGTDKTTCDCKGNMGACACKAGHCACISCPKASAESVSGTA